MFESLLTTTWLTNGAKASAVATGIFLAINRIGAFLDREADDAWKKAAQEYLRGGKFFVQLQKLIGLGSNLFERIFGDRYFSRVAVKRSVQISLLSTIGLWAVLLLYDPHYIEDSQIYPWYYISIILFRLALGMIIDFASTMRVRFFIRGIRKSARPIFYTGVSVIIDVILIIFVGICFELIAESFGNTIDSNNISVQRFISTISTHGTTGANDLVNILLRFNMRSIAIYAAIMPSILFYCTIIGVVLSIFYSKLFPYLTWAASHIKFTKPIKFVANMMGCFFSVIYWVVSMYFN